MSLPEERDCIERCRCTEHGELVCAALTKRQVSDSELCAYLEHVCCSCESVKDGMGRTALHVAASCGRLSVVKWLLHTKHANINIKDFESGYTPLHRSIFYGKIHAAVHLIKAGANLTTTDFNGLTSLEHAMKDCYELSSFCNLNLGEVYVWGSNTNYTLGPQQARATPELLDAYHKEYPNLLVQQICLEKFHCILVSVDGRVFACGHGQGGRLGLSTEKTVIAPEQIHFASNVLNSNICKKASIAIDHSVFLMESGHIMTCGINTHRVLGIQSAPNQAVTPCLIPALPHPVEDICAARYHTVAWGPKAIYTWGLHGGQLGHDKNKQKYIVSPKMVTCLFGTDSKITAVAASNGATAVVTSKGDIYVLHEYQCRKIASRQLSIVSISVVGGKLNDKLDNSLSSEKSHELVVAGLSNVGNLYIWKESEPQFVRCVFSINRFLKVRQVALNLNEVLFVTQQGEAFQGILKPRKKKTSETILPVKKSAFHEFLEKDNCQLLKITKIPRIHRAVSIHSDLKGRNYAVLQVTPKVLLTRIPEVASSNIRKDMRLLLTEASTNDAIHDVVFKVSNCYFPAHHYIIAFSSSRLGSLITASMGKVIELANINSLIFEQLLLFIYTGKCDLIQPGHSGEKFKSLCSQKEENGEKFSDEAKDPVRMLQEAAKRFGVKTLQKLLDHVFYDNGYIVIKKGKSTSGKCKFDRNEFPELQDIVLKTKDNKAIRAHKCVLAARLEYFNNLCSSRWNECSPIKEISLPFSYSILNYLVEFLYTDEVPFLDKEDMDHICSLLILADHLFALGLKEICECFLINFVTLKNVVQTLIFSSLYNAEQLKQYCMEFICKNLAAVLELKSLEVVDDEILHDLTNFYCECFPVIQQRIITPYSYAPSDEVVSAAARVHHISMDENEVDVKATPKPQKRRSRIRRITDNQKKADGNEKVNSSIDEDVSEAKEELPAPKEYIISSTPARLKAITLAQDKMCCDDVPTEFTKLPLRSNNVSISLNDFPALESIHSGEFASKSPPNKNEKLDFKHRIPKMSQKQRKRLSSEGNSSGLDTPNTVVSESPKNPWKIPAEISAASPVGSPSSLPTLESIIGDEKRQKENFVKMRTKLLVYTQMEDKAIEDLHKFYNVDNVFDELISIERVQIGLVASPVWVHPTKVK